jgi:hypothetical protein
LFKITERVEKMNARGMDRTFAMWLPKVLAALHSSAGIDGQVIPGSMLLEKMNDA